MTLTKGEICLVGGIYKSDIHAKIIDRQTSNDTTAWERWEATVVSYNIADSIRKFLGVTLGVGGFVPKKGPAR